MVTPGRWPLRWGVSGDVLPSLTIKDLSNSSETSGCHGQ